MRSAHMLLSRGFAGTERATAEMCNAHGREHAVLLIIRRDHRGAGGASIRDRLDPGVQVVEVGRWWPRAAVRTALVRFAPDVVHAHLRRSTRLLAGIGPAAATIATLHLTVNGPHFAAMDGLICIAAWQQRDIPLDYAGLTFFINESMIPARRLRPEEVAARPAGKVGARVAGRRCTDNRHCHRWPVAAACALWRRSRACGRRLRPGSTIAPPLRHAHAPCPPLPEPLQHRNSGPADSRGLPERHSSPLPQGPATGLIFEHDTSGRELLANAVCGSEIARQSRGQSRGNQFLDLPFIEFTGGCSGAIARERRRRTELEPLFRGNTQQSQYRCQPWQLERQ